MADALDDERQPLTASALKSLTIAKVFRQNKKRITSFDFDDTGEFLVTASEDESIGLYDCKYGRDKKTLYSKKYGIKYVKFAHTSNSILHSSTKEDGN
jgi:COMPASS component SWD2